MRGTLVNLRLAEKKDVQLIEKWWNDSEYMGKYQDTLSKVKLEKIMLKDTDFFIVEKKDHTKIGHINGWMKGRMMEIGYAITPSQRSKGYATEAIQLIADYLFSTKEVERIQAPTDVRNIASQRALEKAGFLREGTMRESWFSKGEYRDMHLYSILREEIKPKKIKSIKP